MSSVKFQNRTVVIGDESTEKTLVLAGKAARSALPVLICGESGTGKELIARFIHEKSEQARGPFVSINCAALPEGLIEAELFGYERGAFTGAVSQRIGKFERANGGTLLLDEISEMPVHLQAKLLRVLQEGEIDRLGGGPAIPIFSRIIATTNRDPMEMIREETFRADLFYRINVIRIDCAPLRGRNRAIHSLAQAFLIRAAEVQGRIGVKLSDGAIEKLLAHTWPGNVRELQNAIERGLLLSDSRHVSAENLELTTPFFEAAVDHRTREGHSGSEKLSDLEQFHIQTVLRGCFGNRTEAARRLGISVRTLRNKLKEYGAA